MNNQEIITTTDRIEALCYRYLCWAKINVELAEEKDKLTPVYIVSGNGIKDVEHKIKVARDTFMAGFEMEQGLAQIDKHVEKLRFFTAGGLS